MKIDTYFGEATISDVSSPYKLQDSDLEPMSSTTGIFTIISPIFDYTGAYTGIKKGRKNILGEIGEYLVVTEFHRIFQTLVNPRFSPTSTDNVKDIIADGEQETLIEVKTQALFFTKDCVSIRANQTDKCFGVRGTHYTVWVICPALPEGRYIHLAAAKKHAGKIFLTDNTKSPPQGRWDKYNQRFTYPISTDNNITLVCDIPKGVYWDGLLVYTGEGQDERK